MRAYLDADVLIWHLQGDKKASQLMARLRKSDHHLLYTGAMQRAEVVFFIRPNEVSAT